MQCRAEAESGTSLTYSTVNNDRVQRRGKTHRDLSSEYADAHGFTELSGDLGAGRSFPVPPCSPSEQGPAAIHLFPQPRKNGYVDGWCAISSIKILTLLKPSYKN